MNSKNIKKHLNAKLKDWTKHIDNEEVKEIVEENTIITGGAMVSLLTGERPHDYDVYFRTKEACIKVAKYYVDKWNATHKDKPVSLRVGEDGSVKCFVQSKGIADEDEKNESIIAYNFESTEQEDEEMGIVSDRDPAEDDGKDKYRPRFLTSNAITLSDKIQIVTRFYGEVADIHKNYDFVHCTCAWSSWDNEVFLPQKALECIINKELYYVGSKYPLCSIIRTRKYLERGYHINAGQYVKMAFQLNELNLYNLETLEDQLTGVDSGYFMMMIEALKKKADETGEAVVDKSYVFELINRMF